MVKLRSIWHWKLQLQGETGTGATLRPRGGTAAKTVPPSSLSAVREMDKGRKQENDIFTWRCDVCSEKCSTQKSTEV